MVTTLYTGTSHHWQFPSFRMMERGTLELKLSGVGFEDHLLHTKEITKRSNKYMDNNLKAHSLKKAHPPKDVHTLPSEKLKVEKVASEDLQHHHCLF